MQIIDEKHTVKEGVRDLERGWGGTERVAGLGMTQGHASV